MKNLPRQHWYTSPYAAQDWSDFHPLKGQSFFYKLGFILAAIGRIILGFLIMMFLLLLVII